MKAGESPDTSRENTGLLLLDKEPGITSFQALNQVKKDFSTTKVGHTGTLDKFASGLLLVLVGRAVKLAPWFSGCDKRYEGIIEFGTETDTLDPEGVIIAEGPVPGGERLEAALAQFRGPIEQAPPAYSAVHVNGERAYKQARSGVAVEMKIRPVTIHALELRSYEPPLAHISVHCSKGTYIRSLARDIALAAGSRGHLTALRRTQVAGFLLSDVPPNRSLLSITPQVFSALGIPSLEADDAAARALVQGKPIGPLVESEKLRPCGETPLFSEAPFGGGASGRPSASGDAAGVFDTTGRIIAVIEKKENRWSYGYVFSGGGGHANP
ncbi:hypothetical protein FACS189493_3240 [Spirochaetia bacterium]|nr:hypothetical protein FACS189493_3240 [Spirochaetia bacterium]